MKLSELYKLFPLDDPDSGRAVALLMQTHWLTVNAVFDPKTGEALPQPLSGFLAKLTHEKQGGSLQDRLWRITEHARPSVERLLRTLNESPRREHAFMPVRAVRELDANSFIKLSNRPGRNIREKLAGKPYLQAVRRYQSVNLPENRLLKAFVTRLAELLELRQACLGEAADELLPKIQSWLLSDEAQTISCWDNLPPNNTLLSHRDYRRVWDAWRWLQTLDDDIDHDFSQLEARTETMQRWQEYGRMYSEGTHLFAEMPILFDYEKFEIKPWVSPLAIQKAPKKIVQTSETQTIFDPACIDLAVLRPCYATTTKSTTSLNDTYLWQQWENSEESLDIDLFNSDAAYLHPDAAIISSRDLFFSKNNSLEHLDRAARTFSYKLRESFKNDTLIWLIPDSLNDFELEITRRNLNACFPKAEPLPCSVAAVFEQVEYFKIKNDGFRVVVVDSIGGKTSATKLIARFDADLKKRLPETNGFYWERCPPVIISERDVEKRDDDEWQNHDIITVDSKGQWHDRIPTKSAQSIDKNDLKRDLRIGPFELYIDLANSPVDGGIRLHALQQRAGDIPLWRDQIPELSIKVMKEGHPYRFYLVSRGKTVKPIRGLSIQIPIDERFTLPAGKRFYQFPLYQGENAAQLRYSARLDSPAFPLTSSTECELILTFQYGDDEPYTLIFVPLDKSFQRIRATWQRTGEEIVTDAPAPDFPVQLSWENLRCWHDAQGNEVDLLEWLIHRFGKLRKISKGYRGQASDENEQRTFFEISRRSFVNRMSLMWSGGRALDNVQDYEWAKQIRGNIQAVNAMREKSQRIEFCVWQMLSCLHRDTPRDCIQWVVAQVEGGSIRDPRSVGFALGDASQEWQQAIFDRLVAAPSNDAISVFAYAIWQDRYFVGLFSFSVLMEVLKVLLKRLGNICSVQAGELGDTSTRKVWTRATTESLELLLGLLRTRASEDPNIRMLLQPHQKITKHFAEQIDLVEGIVAESHVTLLSRVQISIQKPEGLRTPDLLYALRLYLTGDDGANAIHITGISDTDDD